MIKGKKGKRKVPKNNLKQKLLGLIFYRSPHSNLSQFNKTVIRNFILKGLGLEKVLIK